MVGFYQTPYKSHKLSKVTGVRKNHLGENLADYRLKDYHSLSI